jgi:hypothetical protein
MNNPSAAIVSKLNTPVTFECDDVCVCDHGPNESTADKMAPNFSAEYFNHLVFDFEKSKLNVAFDDSASKKHVDDNRSSDPTGYNKAVLRDMADFGCTGDLIEAQVNIEPILSSDASFNHASCQCGHPRFELKEYFDLKSYVHLTSVTLFAKEKEGQMIVSTIYNGIVSL